MSKDDEQLVAQLYTEIKTNMADIFNIANNRTFEKDLNKDIQTFLSYSQDNPPEIVISKPCLNSPLSHLKFQQQKSIDLPNSPLSHLKFQQQTSIDLPSERQSNFIPTNRRASADGYRSNNNVPYSNAVQPKFEKLSSGESRNGWISNRQSSLCSLSSLCSTDTNYFDDEETDIEAIICSTTSDAIDEEPKKVCKYIFT